MKGFSKKKKSILYVLISIICHFVSHSSQYFGLQFLPFLGGMNIAGMEIFLMAYFGGLDLCSAFPEGGVQHPISSNIFLQQYYEVDVTKKLRLNQSQQ